MAEYIDAKGQMVVVSSGIGDGSYYMVCRWKKSGALQRVKSRLLPIRRARREAQADLDYYAAQMGWKKAPPLFDNKYAGINPRRG